MNNNNCILVEFSNEKNKIQTGFSDWLDNKDNVKNMIAIIKEEKVIIIKWPNIDPAPVPKFKIKDAQWSREPIKILKHGSESIYLQKYYTYNLKKCYLNYIFFLAWEEMRKM